MHMRSGMLRDFVRDAIRKHVEGEARAAGLEWGEAQEEQLEIEIGLNTEATAQLVEWAHDEGLPNLSSDESFHSEHEGGRLRCLHALALFKGHCLLTSWACQEHRAHCGAH